MSRPLLALAASLALLTAPAFAQEAPAPTMNLTGTGEVVAEPDMATMTSGLVTEAKTAREALDANNSAMLEIFKVLEAAGIDQRDIQTSNFSVQPEYARNNDSGVARITGYSVSNNVTVRVRDLENLGSMIDAFVSVGANQINDISFGTDDTTALYDEARRAAVTDALAKAQLYADAAHVTLGPIVSITESGGPVPYVADMAMMRVAAEAVPMASGELTISSSVNITWALTDN
ncbi:MAG: SIMPL domain-containing protein [Hyphomicrobiaceae bacterium]|nr:SIMPL domain-containing protein [Hyphomicrobiaceae bacterium]